MSYTRILTVLNFYKTVTSFFLSINLVKAAWDSTLALVKIDEAHSLSIFQFLISSKEI